MFGFIFTEPFPKLFPVGWSNRITDRSVLAAVYRMVDTVIHEFPQGSCVLCWMVQGEQTGELWHVHVMVVDRRVSRGWFVCIDQSEKREGNGKDSRQ
jgi:hypothetical protein